jgi:hypothetical protein
MATRISSEQAASESVVLYWKYPDGSVASGHPLPREQAERLARVYGSMYPDQTYWLEPWLTAEDLGARVQRRRVQIPPAKTK